MSRNEPFSGHFFSFFNTRQSCVLSIRSPVGYHYRQKKNKQLHAPKPPNRQPITIKRLPGNPERTASIPIHLADFKEMAARNFSTGKNNAFYQTAIKNLFHPFGRKTPENVIYVYPLGDYYKLANLTISKTELTDFIKEMDFEGASLSDVFAHLYLYYLTSGKVK